MKLIVKNVEIFLLLVVINLPFLSQANQYVIFVDAGSSASRLHVFQYDKADSFNTIKDVFFIHNNSGLSDYIKYPQVGRLELSKLFNTASQFLLEKQVSLQSVPVHILGTAGMRSLPLSEQQAIYQKVTSYLRENYSFSEVHIQTISGTMEGVYGWLAVNYLLGHLQQQTPTVGSIDMGGESTQITYTLAKPTNDSVKISINNATYYVFSKSFLGVGQDAARKAAIKSELAHSCYPAQHEFMDDRVGTFDFNKCAEVYDNFIKKSGIKKQLLPIAGQQFVVHSAIYHIYNFFEIDKTPGKDTVSARVDAVCNNSWDELQKLYPKVDIKYLSTHCANAVYHSQLLYNTYGLDGSQLNVTNEINQKSFDWSLGAALYHLTQPS